MSLKEISGAVTMNGRLTEGPKCCLKECEKWYWHSKNNFEKIIRIKRQRKEFTYPSLLLDCDSAAAGSLDVEAAVTLEPRLGEGGGFQWRIVQQLINLIYPADKGDLKVYWVSEWTVLWFWFVFNWLKRVACCFTILFIVNCCCGFFAELLIVWCCSCRYFFNFVS